MLHDEAPGKLEVREADLTASLLRAAVPVVATYASVAIGLAWSDGGLGAEFSHLISPLVGVPVVLLFTCTHAVLPVFFYQRYLDTLQRVTPTGQGPSANLMVAAMRRFVGLHMAVWFGIPILALAFLTGWLSLAWAAGHLVLAKRGSRAWVFVEYGSTSMALVLFVVCFSGDNLFPWGLGVVVMQALLLTILDWKAREQWVAPAMAAAAVA